MGEFPLFSKKRNLFLLRRGIFLVFLIFLLILLSSGVRSDPKIDFIDPTPTPGIEMMNKIIGVNISITEASLSNFNFNWNGLNDNIYDNSLLLMMNFDNLSSIGENSTNVVDSSVYAMNGTAYNGTTICGQTADCLQWISSGKFGGAYQFDGANDYIRVPNNTNFTITNGIFTVAYWVKSSPGSLGSSNAAGTVVSKCQGDLTTSTMSNQKGFLIASPYRYSANFPTGISFRVANGSGYDHVEYSSNSTQPIEDGNWHYIVGISNATTLSIYFDSVLVASTPRTYVGDINLPVVNLSIGSYEQNTRFFNGTVDELRIWNRSLSSDEIKQNYLSNLQKYNSSKWDFYANESLSIGYNYYSSSVVNLNGVSNSTQTRTARLLFKTSTYYDNRNAAVVVIGDDIGDGDVSYITNLSNYAQKDNFVFSAAVIAGFMGVSKWSTLQSEINQGLVSIASHSINHLGSPPYDDGTHTTYNEVCGSKQMILGNLTLPLQDQFNGAEYLVGWVEPGGNSDNLIRGNLSLCNYLGDRSGISTYIYSFPSWNSSDGLYNRFGISSNGDVSTLASLNSGFDSAYSRNSIYYLYFHPINNNWADADKLPQHFLYIGNRTDVWYVGFNELYLYHYLEDQARPTVNITLSNNNIITTRINVSSSERNKYGLSYPVTYVFSIPSIWSNAFVLYKNSSLDNYSTLNRENSGDYYNGIDAYRVNMSEHAVYISKGFPQLSNEFYIKIIPVSSTHFGGLTTDFSTVDLSNISNLVLENPGHGKINFSTNINLSQGADLDNFVNILDNLVSIDSSTLPALNKSAIITLYNSYYYAPLILRDGSPCPTNICNIISYNGSTLVFSVNQFSTYYVEETPGPNLGGGGSYYTNITTNNNLSINNTQNGTNIGCNPGELRCSGNESQICSTDKEWITNKLCEYGCENGNCIGSFKNLLDRISNINFGEFPYYVLVAIISIIIGLVIYFLFRHAAKEHARKIAEEMNNKN